MISVQGESTVPAEPCGLGEFLEKTSGECRPCPPDEYMDERNHSRTSCHPCLMPDFDSEQYYKIISLCNKTHNAVISCAEGHCPDKSDPLFPCVRCTSLNTPNGAADLSDISPKTNVMCGLGEFLEKTSGQCRPCPPDEYMDEPSHNRTSCHPCLMPDFDSEQYYKIISLCNKTHNAVISCAEGLCPGESAQYFLCVKCTSLNPPYGAADLSDISPKTNVRMTGTKHENVESPEDINSKENPNSKENSKWLIPVIVVCVVVVILILVVGLWLCRKYKGKFTARKRKHTQNNNDDREASVQLQPRTGLNDPPTN